MIFYAAAGNMEGNKIGRKVTQKSSIDSQVKFLKFNATKTYRMIPNGKLNRTPGWHAYDVGPYRANKGRNKEPISSGQWQGGSAMAGTSVRQRYSREFGLRAAYPPAKRWLLFGSQYAHCKGLKHRQTHFVRTFRTPNQKFQAHLDPLLLLT